MKYIFSLIISGALVVSGFGQTRNVLVGTNNAVVQPTNFWSADASNARTGLGLGSAATNPASAFQPSSSALSNIANGNAASLTNIAASNIVGTISVSQGGTGSTNSSDARTALGLGSAATNPATAFQSSSATLSNLATANGGGLTNLQASNIVGTIPSSNIPSVTFTGITGTLGIIQGGTGATNAANARQNLGSTTVGDAIFVATNAASARTALGSTTIGGNIFTAMDASAVRTLLSLGTASTNPASAFQPASTNLTLLALNDGSALTNLNISGLGTIAISNISGLQSALDGKLATNGSAANLTSFPATILQTTSAITNFPAGLLRTNGDGSGLTNLPVPAVASNVLSTISVAKGGTGATNASGARINLGATTVGDAVFIATNSAAARTALSLGTASTSSVSDFQPSSSTLTNLANNNGGNITNLTAANIVGTVGLASNITGTAALATNVTGVIDLVNGGTGGTNATTARNGLGIGTTNTLTIAGVIAQNLTITAGGGIALQSVITNASSFRTNIGLSWVGLTNTSASGFRTALELGTAATNNSSAFQPSSLVLTNLAANDGGSLTNLQASNLVGTIAASNIPVVNLTNISGVLAVSKGGTGTTNASDARTALGATTIGNSLFTATNAAAARTTLSLGTASTSATTDFQPANANLTNLSTNNGASLTGIPISGVVNLQSNLDTKLATNGNGSGLTSITAANITGTVALASNITGTAALATNVTGVVALANGGTGATNASGARTALGASTVGGNLFTLVNPSAIRFLRLNADNTATALSASDFRTAIGLSTAATNAESAFQPSSTILSNLSSGNGVNLSNLQATNIVGIIPDSNISTVTLTNISGTLPIVKGGTGATNAANARQNLGSTTVGDSIFTATNAAAARTNLGLGWSALTNTNSANFRNAIELGATNVVRFGGIQLYQDGEVSNSITYTVDTLDFNQDGSVFLSLDSSTGGTVIVYRDIAFGGTNSGLNASQTRTNFGLPWTGLTNTNAATFQTALFGSNTNPVLVNTNGEVVSPTNFWQQAPIATTVAFSAPTTNSTNTATNSRNLIIQSLSSNIVNTTNTLLLPTNTSTFNGDTAVVIHAGGSGSATAIRQAGQTSNLIVLTNFDHAVRFLYFNNTWDFYHNVAYVEPIYFSGTNASANAAISRTNLSLGASWLTNTNVTNFRTAIGLGEQNDPRFAAIRIGDTNISFESTIEDEGINWYFNRGTNASEPAITIGYQSNSILSFLPLQFASNNHAATTRTNLGIPLAALTNTNNANFQAAVFATNAAPTNSANVNTVNFNTAVHWMEITVKTNGTNATFRIPLFQ